MEKMFLSSILNAFSLFSFLFLLFLLFLHVHIYWELLFPTIVFQNHVFILFSTSFYLTYLLCNFVFVVHQLLIYFLPFFSVKMLCCCSLFRCFRIFTILVVHVRFVLEMLLNSICTLAVHDFNLKNIIHIIYIY